MKFEGMEGRKGTGRKERSTAEGSQQIVTCTHDGLLHNMTHPSSAAVHSRPLVLTFKGAAPLVTRRPLNSAENSVAAHATMMIPVTMTPPPCHLVVMDAALITWLRKSLLSPYTVGKGVTDDDVRYSLYCYALLHRISSMMKLTMASPFTLSTLTYPLPSLQERN